jgi:hypothetical protein
MAKSPKKKRAKKPASPKAQRPKTKLKADEAYCVRCKGAVLMQSMGSPQVLQNGALMVQGNCAKCKGKVSKFLPRS